MDPSLQKRFRRSNPAQIFIAISKCDVNDALDTRTLFDGCHTSVVSQFTFFQLVQALKSGESGKLGAGTNNQVVS